MGVELNGRVAVVTGAGRGIGAAVARQLAQQGARVVVNDLGVELDGSRREDGPAGELAEQIRAAGHEAFADSSDIADFDQAAVLIGTAAERFGGLDIVVNCAGILRDRMIFNMVESEWDAVIRVHLKGAFNLTRHAAAYWRGCGGDPRPRRLINFTSHAGLHGLPAQPNYAAAKMGVVGFTYSCANALGKYGVTANAISPGAATRMTATIAAERRAATAEDDLAPSHVAAAVGWLASDDAQWCTGQVLRVRGHEIGLYETPRIVARLVAQKGWTPEDIAPVAADAFGPITSTSTNPLAAARARKSS